MNINEMVQFSDQKPAVVQVKNTDSTQVIAIGLTKEQVLKKHITAVPALLVLLKGRISFEMEEKKTVIETMHTFDIPAGVPHEVTGLEESIFLVIKWKP